MNLLFWKKKPETFDPAYAPYEEIDSKRTSKLGYFFLVLMVIFGVWQGNNLLTSIQGIVDRPLPNTTCTNTLAGHAGLKGYNYYNSYYYQTDQYTCQFTEREIALGIDIAYAQIKPLLLELNQIETTINTLSSNLSQAQYQNSQNLQQYQTALTEDISQTEGVLSSTNLGGAVSSGSQTVDRLQAELNKAQAEKTVLENKIKVLASSHTSAIEAANSAYERELSVYELSIFIVSIILIAPLFYFSWRKYGQVRRVRSEYAIIWGGVVATFGIMVAQILLVFVYEILPHKIIQAVLAFLSGFEIIWTLLYWLAFILVPAFFGFLIYLIQKKFYNKQAVIMRALKSGHCPHCSLKVLPSMNNCPVCGYHLKTKCESCSAMSTNGGSFCEICGVRRTTPEAKKISFSPNLN